MPRMLFFLLINIVGILTLISRKFSCSVELSMKQMITSGPVVCSSSIFKTILEFSRHLIIELIRYLHNSTVHGPVLCSCEMSFLLHNSKI